VRRLGPLSLVSAETTRLARLGRTSAYRVVATALDRNEPRFGGAAPAWLRVALPSRHPWLRGLEDAPAGKRLHVDGLARAGLRGLAPSLVGVLDEVHPLLSQPILETVLGIPADLFVQGGRGRALARAAFADRLPAKILARRSKGELGAFYARSLVAALPEIRAFLRDGLLADRGLVDRDLLGQALEETALAETSPIGAILGALAMEAWVRRWR